MRIQNNIMAMNTHRMYTTNNNNVSKSAEKLSSGYRINRAGDDAAGLAISEKMRAQVRGLNMASKNSQDAISLVQTSEGALQEVHSMLQRMNELSVQSATGTNADFDRTQIAAEFDQLKGEIDQIAETTNFNNRKLLDGTMAATGKVKFTAATTTPAADAFSTIDLSDFNLTQGAGFKVGDWTYKLNLVGQDGYVQGATANDTTNKVAYIEIPAVNQEKTSANAVAIAGRITNAVNTNTTAAGITGIKAAAVDADGLTTGTNPKDHIKIERNAGTDPAITKDTVSTFEGGLKIQVGAEQGNTLSVSVEAMNSKALGLKDISIDTQAKAGDAITSTRDAIDQVSEQRARLGAMQNRLDHKIANLDNTAENLQAAESRIRDVDIAKEMTTYTKNNILSQASTAMLAQANAAPQNVLSLLQ